MAVSLSPIGGVAAQFFDNNGNILAGGKLYSYEAGTTTPKTTYTSAAGTIANTNPIILTSAGRIPYEVWLTTGDSYKFVLTDSVGNSIGTWDNIYGYSSGSLDAQTEVQTATAGQTLFVLTTMAYNPGANTLGVYVDGVNQVVTNAYVETNATSVTFVSGLHDGATVKFINLNIGSTDASVVTYAPGGAGAVATTVQAKLRESVSVKDFGAVGDGVADDTVAIQAALDSGAKEVNFPSGTYLISSIISSAGVTVSSNTILVGHGLPTIKADDNAFPSGGNVITLGNSGTDIIIDGLKIDANNANNGSNIYGIRGELIQRCTIKNCTVINFDYGILFADGNTLKVENCTVHTGVYYGICVKGDDVLEDVYNVTVTGCVAHTITTGGTGPAVDGKGIIIYGRTGATLGDYKNIEDVVISNNIAYANGAGGINVTAVSNFSIVGNSCYDNLSNTDTAHGILVSEACLNGAITGNNCTNNYDAGILLDIADQTVGANYFLYGQLAVTGNACKENIRTGIKINSCPFSTITGNFISGRRTGTNTLYGILLSNAGVNNISSNNISYCEYNAIRVTAAGAGTPPSQQRVVLADNLLTNNTAPSSDSNYAALYLDLWDGIMVQNNLFSENTWDLHVGGDAANVTLLNNRFTSKIYTAASELITKWDDEFRTTAAGYTWTSPQFTGDGMSAITIGAGFTIPHFGIQYLPIGTNGNNYTSDLTTAIYPGYLGQKIVIIKLGSGTATIKQGANTENIGDADVVLATGEMIEYTYTGSLWLQTTAKLATSL